jgi:WD40 repeat protein
VLGSLSFSADGTWLAGSADNRVVVWDTAKLSTHAPKATTVPRQTTTEPDVAAALPNDFGGCSVVAFSPDSAMLLTANSLGGVRLWDWSAGAIRADLQHNNGVTAVAFSRDGRQLAVAANNGVYLRDAKSGKLQATFRINLLGSSSRPVIRALAFTPEGAMLAIGVSDIDFGPGTGELHLWDLKNAKPLAAVKAHPKALTALAFTPDGKTLATCGADEAKLWDVPDLKERRMLKGHQGTVNHLAIAPDGKTLVTCGSDRRVKRWDLAEGKELWSRDEAGNNAVLFGADGSFLAAALDHSCLFLDADTGKRLPALPKHVSRWTALALSPDGKYLATEGVPDQLAVYDLAKVLARRAP